MELEEFNCSLYCPDVMQFPFSRQWMACRSPTGRVLPTLQSLEPQSLWNIKTASSFTLCYSLSPPRKGIGPTYASKMNRTGVRLADLMDNFPDFSNKFSILADNYMASFPGLKVRERKLELEKYSQMLILGGQGCWDWEIQGTSWESATNGCGIRLVSPQQAGRG